MRLSGSPHPHLSPPVGVPAIRKSLRLRVKEGKANLVVPGERFSSDTNEGRELAQRHPALRNDRDYNQANPGITLVEVAL